MKHTIFLHIPKAGGSTLRTILHRQFRGKATYLIGDDLYGDSLRFQQLSKQDSSNYALIIGHMRYGLHRQFDSDFTYITMLREPISRVVSEFQFIRSNTDHPQNRWVADMSIDDYINSGITDQASNGQVRLLSGTESISAGGIPQVRPMTKHDLNTALDNIHKHFRGLGFIERYDQSLILWKRLFDWRYPLYIKENVTKSPASKKAHVSSKQRQRIADLNQLDIQLYNTLLAEFDAQIKSRGIAFKLQLGLFKTLNTLFSIYIRLRAMAPRFPQ